MNDSRELFCVKACEGMGTGELAAMAEEGVTLKQQMSQMAEELASLRSKNERLVKSLSSTYSRLRKECCGTVLDKTDLMKQIRDTLVANNLTEL